MYSRLAAALAAALLSISSAIAAEPHHAAAPGPSADAVLKELAAGNARYVAGKLTLGKGLASRRAEVVRGQHPKAIVLGCSDSRVPPELLFDQGIGDLFVVRVAGNVAATDTLGSVEYAADHLGAPLVIVLGHTGCGAVAAACAGGHVEGHVAAIVEEIRPAVERVKEASPEACAKAAVPENARLVAASLPKESPILAKLVADGKLRIVTGVYDLATGAVTLLP
jgi:carbonic anhydrase